MEERRLCDRVLHALQMALEQGNLEVSEYLASALELTLTSFGGADKVERRDLPDGVMEAMDRLEGLRRQAISAFPQD